MIGKKSGRRWTSFLAVGVLAGLGASFAAASGIGLLSLEHHVGFFAPVWAADGRHVYVIQRETHGLIWGMGWECFSPPAWVYIASDRLDLQRLDSVSGRTEVLETFDGSPLVGRVTRHYRGSIFNFVSARIEPGEAGADFLVAMNVPRVPSSEQWTLRGAWAPGQPSHATWKSEWGGSTAAPEAVLMDGVELLAVPGSEGFPAAVLAIEADGSSRILIQSSDFAQLYPDGVPAERIAERSSRERIERARELRRVETELVARFRREGASEGDALLRAYDAMEEQGLLPRSPRLVASTTTAPPAGVRIFEIPEEYFRVGLFQDVAAAVAEPGKEVATGTGTYLKYYDDDLGPRLRAWREAGNDRFGVRTGARLYVLEVRRFDP